MFAKLFKKTKKPVTPAEVYTGLRNQILNSKPSVVGIEPSTEMPNVWGVLMETGHTEAVVTLVSLADGTTSLYFSKGGGMIDGGGYETVAQASKSFVVSAENYYQKMMLTESYPSPLIGRVKFYVLTYSGIYTIDLDVNELLDQKQELSPLFYSGHEVITQFRLIQEQKN